MTNERARRIVDVPSATPLPDPEHPEAEHPGTEPAGAESSVTGAAAGAVDDAAEASEVARAVDAVPPADDQPEAFATDAPANKDAPHAEEPDDQDAAEPSVAEVAAVAEDDPAEPDDDDAVTAEYEALPSVLEALLFVADEPIAASALGRALELTPAQVRRGLDELAEALREEGRGVRLQQGPDGAQLVTAPDLARTVEHFLGLEANRRLSNAALETLAIVAYRQPVTRHAIDQIRGVNSDGTVATLRARGLIEGIGRAPGPGPPLLFSTTQRFLEHFGLERPDELPPLPEEVALPAEAHGAQLALETAVDEEVGALEDADQQASQLTFDDEARVDDLVEASDDEDFEDEDFEGGEFEDEQIERDGIEDDPELEISGDLDDLSRAAGAALGGPGEAPDATSDDRSDE